MKPLPKNVKTLGWISFFTDVSSEMIFPLLPVYVAVVLGGGPMALGLIEGISETTASLLKLVSGFWSDRVKDKRRFVWFGYGFSSLLRSLMGLTHHWLPVLGIRFGDRVGKGMRSAPRDAMIAASVAPEQRGHAFGFHRMMDHSGAVIGSLLAAGLLWIFPQQYRLVFACAIVPSFFTLIFLTRIRAVPSESISAKTFSLRDRAFIPKHLKCFLLLVFLFNLGNATDAFILLRLQQAGIAIPLLPLLWAGFHVIKAISNQYLGKLSDKMNRIGLVLLGWLLYAVIYGLFARPWGITPLIILFMVYGIFYGLTEAPEKALLVDLSKQERFGSLFGVYHFLLGLSLLPASLLFGFFWKFGGPSLAFQVASVLTFAATVGLFTWYVYYGQKRNPVRRDPTTNDHQGFGTK